GAGDRSRTAPLEEREQTTGQGRSQLTGDGICHVLGHAVGAFLGVGEEECACLDVETNEHAGVEAACGPTRRATQLLQRTPCVTCALDRAADARAQTRGGRRKVRAADLDRRAAIPL